MSVSIFPEKARKEPAKINNFVCNVLLPFLLVSNENPDWFACLAIGYRNTLAIATLNVRGGFFLLFLDVSLDISHHGKFISEKSVSQALHHFPTVWVSKV